MTLFTPHERRRVRVISRSVRPEISTRALGRSLVSGRKRVPSPAARIMAFGGDVMSSLLKGIIAGGRGNTGFRDLTPRKEREKWAPGSRRRTLQFPMVNDDFDSGTIPQTLGKLFGEINGPML